MTKIYNKKTAEYVLEYDESKFPSLAKYLDSLSDDEYDAVIPAGQSELDLGMKISVFYGLYKDMEIGGSQVEYNSDTKCITVITGYSRSQLQSKVDLYNILHKTNNEIMYL